MSLPIKAIERLFKRLSAIYGTEFTNRYAGVDENDMKSLWAHELSGFDGDLQSLAWALENLPARCPNVIEFRTICRRAPRADAPRLPQPKADPERVRAELARLLPDVKSAATVQKTDPKAWARRVLARHESGEYRTTPTCLRFAREALFGTHEVLP